MESEEADVVILVADVTASVAMYESLGDAAAYGRISRSLDLMREIVASLRGEALQSRGDDVLCVFGDAAAAAEAAARMLEAAGTTGVSLHLSVHRGGVIRARDSVYGDAVNVAYRLASVANEGEALLSGAAVATLPAYVAGALTPLPPFRFKGRSKPVDAYAYAGRAGGEATTLPAAMLAAARAELGGEVRLRILQGDAAFDVGEAESLSIGRASDCDVVAAQPWVSRRHAVLHVRDGVATIVDRSSHGSYVAIDGGPAELVRRRSATLSGSGVIALGAAATSGQAEVLSFEVGVPDRGDAPLRR